MPANYTKQDSKKMVSIAGYVTQETFDIMSEQAQIRDLKISKMVRLVIEGWTKGEMVKRLRGEDPNQLRLGE
jgi:hypothetical protein